MFHFDVYYFRYGAYSFDKIYKPTDILYLLHYARLRGIRILLEVDAPSHAGNGWQWGPQASLGNLAVCINKTPWRSYCIQPPCGQLNPVNDNLYGVLGDLFQDIISLFPKHQPFHMGGDEVFIAVDFILMNFYNMFLLGIFSMLE